MNSLKIFRFISIAEGISAILLFGVAMPLKYIFAKPFLISSVGMAHGVLFIAFVLLSIIYKFKVRWSSFDFIIILICSFVPLGTFYVDKKYLAKIKA